MGSAYKQSFDFCSKIFSLLLLNSKWELKWKLIEIILDKKNQYLFFQSFLTFLKVFFEKTLISLEQKKKNGVVRHDNKNGCKIVKQFV